MPILLGKRGELTALRELPNGIRGGFTPLLEVPRVTKNWGKDETKGKQRDRRYWEIFAASHGSVRNAFPGVDIDGPCPFAGNAQQPMRNLAIARALEQEGMVDEAWSVLCAHDGNPDVPGHWKEWAEMLPDPAITPSLPASAVIDAGEAEGYGAWAAWMRERYRLGERV